LIAAATELGGGSVRLAPGATAKAAGVGQLTDGKSQGANGLRLFSGLINPVSAGALPSRGVNGPSSPNCAHSVRMMLV
jgi:hypothetical protein